MYHKKVDVNKNIAINKGCGMWVLLQKMSRGQVECSHYKSVGSREKEMKKEGNGRKGKAGKQRDGEKKGRKKGEREEGTGGLERGQKKEEVGKSPKDGGATILQQLSVTRQIMRVVNRLQTWPHVLALTLHDPHLSFIPLISEYIFCWPIKSDEECPHTTLLLAYLVQKCCHKSYPIIIAAHVNFKIEGILILNSAVCFRDNNWMRQLKEGR